MHQNVGNFLKIYNNIDTIHKPCLPHKKLRHIVRDNCTYEQGDLLESIQTEAAQIYTSLTRNS